MMIITSAIWDSTLVLEESSLLSTFKRYFVIRAFMRVLRKNNFAIFRAFDPFISVSVHFCD